MQEYIIRLIRKFNTWFDRYPEIIFVTIYLIVVWVAILIMAYITCFAAAPTFFLYLYIFTVNDIGNLNFFDATNTTFTTTNRSCSSSTFIKLWLCYLEYYMRYMAKKLLSKWDDRAESFCWWMKHHPCTHTICIVYLNLDINWLHVDIPSLRGTI